MLILSCKKSPTDFCKSPLAGYVFASHANDDTRCNARAKWHTLDDYND